MAEATAPRTNKQFFMVAVVLCDESSDVLFDVVAG